MRRKAVTTVVLISLIFLVSALPGFAQASFGEGFDDTGPTNPGDDGPSNLIASGWIFRNQSEPEGERSWFGYSSGAHSGTGFLAVDYASTDCGTDAAISNWAILPAIPNQAAGDTMTFYVKGGSGARVDRLQLRYSPSGQTDTGSGADDVGDFTELLLDWQSERFGINDWEPQSVTLPGTGRIAFRYFLPDADACTSYAAFLGIDTLVIGTPPAGEIPIPQPGQSVTWDQSISPVTIEGRVIIPAGGTVVVEPGVEIRVNRDSTLVVDGTVEGAGTPESRIAVTAAAVFPPAVEVSGRLDLTYATVGGQVRPQSGGTLLFANTTFQDFGTVFSDGGGVDYRPPYLRFDQSHFEGVDLYVAEVTTVLANTTFHNASALLSDGYAYLDNVTIDGGSLSLSKDYQPVYINNVTVTNSPGAGLSLGGGNAGNDYYLGPNVVLQNNLYPVSVGGGGLVPGSNVPSTGNVNNYIAGPGFGDHRGPVTWSDVGIPYVITEFPSLLGSWELLPGVTVQLGPGAGIEADDGNLTARGLPGTPVTFERLDPQQAWNRMVMPNRLEHAVVDGGELGLVYASLGPPRYIDSSVLSNNGRL